MTFTAEFQRRLRAVLALRVQAPIPSDAVIVIETEGVGYDDSRGLELAIVIRTADFRASYSYLEPDAWPALLADLEAVPEPVERP